MTTESDIVWEGQHVYVVKSRFRMRGFEVRVNSLTHAIIAGWGKDKDGAIRTAQKLDVNGWRQILEG